MSSGQLPDVYQADLDPAAFGALFADLAALPHVQVSVKADAQTIVSEGPTMSLSSARAALEAGEIRALQVRYEFEGAVWIDTILRTPLALRLVRMQAYQGGA